MLLRSPGRSRPLTYPRSGSRRSACPTAVVSFATYSSNRSIAACGGRPIPPRCPHDSSRQFIDTVVLGACCGKEMPSVLASLRADGIKDEKGDRQGIAAVMSCVCEQDVPSVHAGAKLSVAAVPAGLAARRASGSVHPGSGEGAGPHQDLCSLREGVARVPAAPPADDGSAAAVRILRWGTIIAKDRAQDA